MATLVSPGVHVSVQDDSFYPASGAGSVPLVIFATAQDKLVPGSTSTVAAGTKKANAGKLYLMTSQRDALQTFGMPIFQENAGTVVQGDELNEYGLHALTSALGITNRAYGLRADIDLNALKPTQKEPRNVPLNQTVWFDIKNTSFGIFEHLGTTSPNQIANWKAQNVLVPEVNQVNATTGAPVDSLGVVGDYAVVPYLVNSGTVNTEISVANTTIATNRIYRKQKETGNVWQLVTNAQYEAMTPPVTNVKGTVWVKLDSTAGGMNLKVQRYNTNKWETLPVIAEKSLMAIEAKLGLQLRAGTHAFDAENKYLMFRAADTATVMSLANTTVYNNQAVTLSYTEPSAIGIQTYTQTFTNVTTFVSNINSNTPLSAVANGNQVTISAMNGRMFSLSSPTAPQAGDRSVVSSRNWSPSRYMVQTTAPTRTAAKDTLWYDDSLYADAMINDGGRWRGLQSAGGKAVLGASSIADIQIRQAAPSTKGTGGNLAYGDLWIDPQDGTNFEFYQFQQSSWVKLDTTDQSTTNGVLFADARCSDENGVGYYTGATAADAKAALLKSDYVDPNCPDPRLYPRGMVMINMQQTGGVVRKYVEDAFTTVAFVDYNADNTKEEFFNGAPDSYALDSNGKRVPLTLASVAGSKKARWITESGLAGNGAGLFGREAQRKIVTRALAATIVGNDDLRSETIEFNIVAAPGYVEMLDELVTLNTDRKETAYIITDVPARLAPNATAINAWAKNTNNAPENGSFGRITRYAYAAQYMGWGLGTNIDGKNVAIPGSSIALRTYLYNDSVSYVWFPPAGTERGVVTNAASIGYVNAEGEYAPVIYNQGQRDTMYLNNINPIAMRPNRGLLVFGDKSLSPDTTALDRVNVGRLVVYIRTEVAKISERFLFKLNTPRVREEFAGALTAFLANIVQLEGLEDFAVVCDSSNNTALRTSRNELWADIAIVPTKSINFIYVPIRIQNKSN